MKTTWLIFGGGLVLGGALMGIFRTYERGEKVHESVPGTRVSVRVNDSTNRSVSRKVHEGQAGEGLIQEETLDQLFLYLDEITQTKNHREPNYLKMVRQGAIIGSLSAEEAQELIAQMDIKLEENPKLGGFSKIITRMAFMRWCELDGPAAIADLLVTESALIAKDGKHDLAEAGIQAWTETNPEGARIWMEARLAEVDELASSGGHFNELEGPHRLMKNGDFYKFFLENYIDEKGESVFEILESVQSEQIKSSLRNNIVESLAEREDDPAKLQSLLEMTQAGEFNGRREVLRKLTEQSPTEARRWTENQEPSKERDHFVTMVAGEWLARDPANAADWYLRQELVENNRQQDRYSRIFGAWRLQDLAEANEWLRSQPDTPSRDTAESLAANSAIGQKEYVEAVSWVSGIHNDGLRAQAFDRIFKNAKRQENGELPSEMIQAAQDAGFEFKE